MQVTVTFPDEVSDRLQQMADDEQITVAEILVRIAERTVFATAHNVPPIKNGSSGEPKLPLRTRNIMDFAGIGAKWADPRDAQERINELRDEWDAPKLDADGNPL